MNRQRSSGRTGKQVKVSPARTTAISGSDQKDPSIARTMGMVPFNPHRLEQARDQWLSADWRGLAADPRHRLDEHPQRSELAIVRAAALLQLGDRSTARELARCAASWSIDRSFMAKVLLASAHHCLGRASAAARRDTEARRHFEASIFEPRMMSQSKRIGAARMQQVLAELDVRRDVAARDYKAGLGRVPPERATWLSELADRCLAAADMHEAIDDLLDHVLVEPDDRVRFLLLVSAHLRARRDNLTAINYLSVAKDFASGASKQLTSQLAKNLISAGQQSMAMDLLFDRTLDDTEDDPTAGELVRSIRSAYRGVREAEQAAREHGHELLLAYLKLELPKIRAAAAGRRLVMVEIGTTRESVPGQGSSRRLGEFCMEHGITFVTVDMDPHNTRVAQRMFDRLDWNHTAVSMKGEEFLRNRRETIDFLFLDAYDFDHGQHSELRQSRYEKFLGSRIDEQACHQMHLDCAVSARRLLSPTGVICVDDTWLEDGHWTAKGTLAMPYLLANGFELIEARNRASLLKRCGAAVTCAQES